jgi:hypothetical protein
MTRRQKIRFGVYVKGSTANPTGWRPWNSRLSYYAPGAFSIPTSGQGPFLLTAGTFAKPSAAGGLSGVTFPNYAGFSRSRTWRSHAGYPTPVYRAPGLGAALPISTMRHVTPVSFATPATGGPSATFPPVSGRNAAILNPAGGWTMPQPWHQAPAATVPSTANTISPSQPGYFVTSSPETGSITSFVPAPGVTPLNQSQYAAIQAAGTTAQTFQSPAQAAAAAEAAANAAQAAAAQTSAASTATSTAAAPNILTEDSLGWGLPNIAYAGIAIGLVLILKGKR